MVTLLYFCNLATVYFWYTLIVLIFFYIPLYYLMFQYPKSDRCKTESFWIVNILFFLVFAGIFFGVYFGVFFSTMRYPFHKVENCQIIGQQTVGLGGVGRYSILYVDFNKDGENMLGYGCVSINSGSSAGVYFLFPQNFYHRNDFYQCLKSMNSDSYNIPSKRILQSKRQRITIQNNNIIYCYYYLSNVKLPDWMCLPQDKTQSDLTQKQSCYVHYYKGNSNTDQAIKNSKERINLREANEFAIVTFQYLQVPLDQYMCLLIFTFCPFIMSLNIFFEILTKNILNHLEKKLKKYLIFQRIGKQELNEIIYTISHKIDIIESPYESVGDNGQLNIVDQGSPIISNLNTSNRQQQQQQEQDVVIYNLDEINQLQQISINKDQKKSETASDNQNKHSNRLKEINLNQTYDNDNKNNHNINNYEQNVLNEQILFLKDIKNTNIDDDEEEEDKVEQQIVEEWQGFKEVIEENESQQEQQAKIHLQKIISLQISDNQQEDQKNYKTFKSI